MKTLVPKLEHYCFKQFKNSADGTGLWGLLSVVWLLAWIWSVLYFGGIHPFFLIFLAGSVTRLIFTLRDKYAVAYLLKHPESLKEDADKEPSEPAHVSVPSLRN